MRISEESLERIKQGRKNSNISRSINVRNRYDIAPKYCSFCNKILPFEKRDNKYCNHSCAAKVHFGSGAAKVIKKKYFCIVCGNPCKNEAKKYCSSRCMGNQKLSDSYDKFLKGEIKNPRNLRRCVYLTQGWNCDICKITEWNGVDVPLVLDHIDGNYENCLPNNLRLICPNCDALLSTYKGKNKGSGRHNRKQRYRDGKSF
jgi:hypothetical protein